MGLFCSIVNTVWIWNIEMQMQYYIVEWSLQMDSFMAHQAKGMV